MMGALHLPQRALVSATNERSWLIMDASWRAPVPAVGNGITAAGNIRFLLRLIPLTVADTLSVFFPTGGHINE